MRPHVIRRLLALALASVVLVGATACGGSGGGGSQGPALYDSAHFDRDEWAE